MVALMFGDMPFGGVRNKSKRFLVAFVNPQLPLALQLHVMFMFSLNQLQATSRRFKEAQH